MTEIAAAYLRLRPSLSPDDRASLEDLGRQARALADGIDMFLGNYAAEPDPPAPRPHLERET